MSAKLSEARHRWRQWRNGFNRINQTTFRGSKQRELVKGMVKGHPQVVKMDGSVVQFEVSTMQLLDWYRFFSGIHQFICSLWQHFADCVWPQELNL